MDLIEKLKKRKEILISKRNEQKRKDKNEIIRILALNFSDDDVKRYRKLIYMASNGFAGLDYDEYDIKEYILIQNKKLFEEEEYLKYLNEAIPNLREKSKVKK